MLLIAQGKEQAFTQLYGRYAKKMLYFFYQRLYQDEARAQDFLHDLFLKLLEKPHLFNPDKCFKTWIYALATNMCKNEYRRDALRGVQVHNFAFESVEELKPTSVLADRYDKQYFATQLKLELNKLDDNHRLVFILRYQEELTVSQISEILDCPEGTVKSRLFYGIKKLAQSLKAFTPADDNI